MKKIIAIILALCLTAFAVPAFAETAAPIEDINSWVALEAAKLDPSEKEVNVLTWTYYIPDEVVDEFINLTGINVNYASTMGDNEDMKAKLASAPDQYDLLVVSDYIIGTMAQMELLQPLDKSKIPNYSNIDPAYQSQFYDPENLYTIPYTNTIPLICYNADAVPFEVKGYADLWRPEFENSLACVGEMRAVTGMAQKKLGFSYNETDPQNMAKVADELEALKPNILTLNSDTPHHSLTSGDAKAGFMFGSQIVDAQKLLPNLKVVYPEEGLGFGIDNIVLSSSAPHIDATYIFINYLLDGRVSAYASDLIDYANCNLAAPEFMTDEYKANETVNVPAELVAKAEMIMPVEGDVLKMYDDIWVNFRQ